LARRRVGVNVTLKSGTNQYHGKVVEFLRNFDTDATPFFQQAGDGKPIYQQNQFGTTFDRGPWRTSGNSEDLRPLAAECASKCKCMNLAQSTS
jgi:hypothetical protein